MSGFLVGLSPEILSRIGYREPRFTAQLHPSSLPDALQAALRLPQTVLELLQPDGSVFRVASMLLTLWAVIRFLRRRGESLRPLRVALGLSLLLFCFVSTYTSATPRYLFPAFPVAVFAIGALAQELWASRSMALGAFVPLLAFQLAGHSFAQLEFAGKQLVSGEAERRLAIVDAFRAAGVPVVVTEQYADSNPLTLMSREMPVFVHTEWLAGKRFIERATASAHQGERVGFLLGTTKEARTSFRWNGRDWRLSRIAEIGGMTLYSGTP